MTVLASRYGENDDEHKHEGNGGRQAGLRHHERIEDKIPQTERHTLLYISLCDPRPTLEDAIHLLVVRHLDLRVGQIIAVGDHSLSRLFLAGLRLGGTGSVDQGAVAVVERGLVEETRNGVLSVLRDLDLPIRGQGCTNEQLQRPARREDCAHVVERHGHEKHPRCPLDVSETAEIRRGRRRGGSSRGS